jgi:beta-phosphoglucomutase
MDQSTNAEKKKQMIEDNSHMGVIFDLDGVLVDTGWAHKQAWYDLAEKEGFDMSDDFFYKTFGMRNDQIIPMLAGGGISSEDVEQLSQWKEERYRELVVENLILPPGVGELLGDLKRNGFLMAVGSSAPKANLELVLECVKIRDYFNACVTGEEVFEGKPAPETFIKAAQKLGLPPDCCVVVEDAVQGVEAGKAAGMLVVAVTTTRDRPALSTADIIVDGLGELKAKDFAKLLKD